MTTATQPYTLDDLRRLERRVSEPLDPEREGWEAQLYRYVGHRGEVHRVRTVAGSSFVSGTQTELVYPSVAAGTAKNTFTGEAQVNDTAGMGTQAVLSPYFHQPGYGNGKALRFTARGLLSSTGTPTFTYFCRLVSLSGPLIAGTAALTTLTTITNQLWEAEWDTQMVTMGAAGGNNSTMRSAGLLSGPAALAAPGVYAIWGGAAQPGTVTMDVAASNLIFFDLSCSASSASNGVTLLQLLIQGLN